MGKATEEITSTLKHISCLNRLIKDFHQIDKNSDSDISFGELKNYLKNEQMTDEELRKLIKEIDDNFTDGICLGELTVRVNRQIVLIRNLMKEYYDKMDGNKDGLLTFEELESVVNEFHQLKALFHVNGIDDV
ncbi:hypothetical protein SNEBB_008739 [Seison nebaliae]|nr:hypothetical protein SNEBB_008739 [Seison nebaliae]